MGVSRIFIDGKTPKSAARAAARKAANRNYKTSKLSGWEMSAVQRRTEIRTLARLRIRSGTGLGSESGWIECIANYLRVRAGKVTADDLRAEAKRLGLPPFRQQLVDDAILFVGRAAWGRYQLYSPQLAGDKLQLTAREREEAGIVRIAAVDESPEERRRRQDRERKAKKRAASAALAPKIRKVDLARSLGISRPTLDAWIAKGLVDAETGELSDFTFPVRRSLLLRNDQRTKNVKSRK